MDSFPRSLKESLRQTKVVAVFSVDKVDHAVPIAKALLSAGLDTIELTLRTPAALSAVEAVCAEVEDMNVGVGTILTPDQVREVKSLGAQFGVSPGLNPSVVKTAQESELPFAPGVATPSELESAIELGCQFVKFFPAEPMGGVRYLKSMSAPYNHLGIEFMPLGGVNRDNMLSYLSLPNVLALGGSFVVNKEMVSAENWDAIADNARQIIRSLSA